MHKNPVVDEFLAELDHPMTKEIQAVREIILSAHPDIKEAIKWKSPTFIYKGNMASYFLNAKKHVSLMFHKGKLIHDDTGLLEGEGKEGRTARFGDLEDIERKKANLIQVIHAWVRLMDDQ